MQELQRKSHFPCDSVPTQLLLDLIPPLIIIVHDVSGIIISSDTVTDKIKLSPGVKLGP